jgi:Rab GDP dissociation inhibitor
MSEGKHYDDDGEGKGESKKDFPWLPSGTTALADGEYDAIVLGTGLTECIISGLLSVQGKRVLHLDRNNYYGADTASLSLQNLFKKFRGSENPSPSLGPSRGNNLLLNCFLFFNEGT